MKMRANDIDIHHDISGSGPWLPLSHSLCCDGSLWQPQLAVIPGASRLRNIGQALAFNRLLPDFLTEA